MKFLTITSNHTWRRQRKKSEDLARRRPNECIWQHEPTNSSRVLLQRPGLLDKFRLNNHINRRYATSSLSFGSAALKRRASLMASLRDSRLGGKRDARTPRRPTLVSPPALPANKLGDFRRALTRQTHVGINRTRPSSRRFCVGFRDTLFACTMSDTASTPERTRRNSLRVKAAKDAQTSRITQTTLEPDNG